MARAKAANYCKKKRINSGSYQLRESLILTYSPARGCEDQRNYMGGEGQEQKPVSR